MMARSVPWSRSCSSGYFAPMTSSTGCVAGKPGWSEYQLRILDETLRWIETFDQPGARKLAVDLQTQVEAARGER